MNKPKRGLYKTRIPPLTQNPKRNELISKDDAITFITAKTNRWRSDSRADRNKVAGMINYAIKRNQLSINGGKIEFGRLMAWACEKTSWAEALKEFPRIVEMSFEEKLSIHSPADTLALPGAKEACHEALNREHQQNVQLREELRKQCEEIERLRPAADGFEKMCEKNRINGSKREM